MGKTVTSTQPGRFVIAHKGGYNYAVVDTTNSKTVFEGFQGACKDFADSRNSEAAKESERIKGMIIALLSPLMEVHNPHDWGTKPSDMGTTIMAEDGTEVAHAADDEEALALCRRARTFFDERQR